MDLQNTLIYLVCGISFMIVFGLLIFVFGMAVVSILEKKNAKSKDVVEAKESEESRLAAVIAERGFKVYKGE